MVGTYALIMKGILRRLLLKSGKKYARLIKKDFVKALNEADVIIAALSRQQRALRLGSKTNDHPIT